MRMKREAKNKHIHKKIEEIRRVDKENKKEGKEGQIGCDYWLIICLKSPAEDSS